MNKDEQETENVANEFIGTVVTASRVLIMVMVPLTILSILYQVKVSIPAGVSEWQLTLATFFSSVSTNVIPVLIAVSFINPISRAIGKSQDRASDRRRTTEIANAVIEGMDVHMVRVGDGINLIKEWLGADTPVCGFYPSFEDIDWDKDLAGARSIDIVVFYWSDDWLNRNITAFQRAISRGTIVSIYLPNTEKHRNDFYDNACLSEKAKLKVLKTAGKFIKILRRGGGDGGLFLINSSVNYMAARVSYENRTAFYSSTFRNGSADADGRPPVFLLDEERCDDRLRDFIGNEFSFVSQSARVPNFDSDQYFEWSENHDRVVVSISLSCSMRCSFCYVESVAKNRGSTFPDGEILGSLLASALWFDERFDRTRSVVLLGGMTDPLLGRNASVTLSFLQTLRRFGASNVVHIATRANIKTSVRQFIISDKKIVVGMSLSCLSKAIDIGAADVERRFEDAKSMIKEGANISVYMRPVIPGVSVRDASKIANLARSAGIKDVVVGGLYVDTRIRGNLNKASVNIPDVVHHGRMIMDRDGVLEKIESDDVADVKRIFRDLGFNVYGSSFAIAKSVD